MMQERKRRIAVLGASGTVGRLIIERLITEGYDVVCQTRNADKLAHLAGRADVYAFDPRNSEKLASFVEGTHAVILALGTNSTGATTLFSDVTAALLAVMKAFHITRLIVITGVGAGETRGHGGFLYDWIIFPLFTRKRYQDKDRQEDLISFSGLDWTIVRPAPFNEKLAAGPLEVVTEIRPETRLTSITRDEVAKFVVEQLDNDRHVRQRPFIGHG